MKFNVLHLWFLANPAVPRHVGQLRLVEAGKGVSLQYAVPWLSDGFPLSEDLPLTDSEHLPRWKGMAAGAVDDARPDRWGERVIQALDRPARLSLMEYLYHAGDDRFGALGVSTSAEKYLHTPAAPCPGSTRRRRSVKSFARSARATRSTRSSAGCSPPEAVSAAPSRRP